MADQISTKRPNGTVSLGNWSVVGAGGVAHTALSDNLDTTYVQNANRCTLRDQRLRLNIADWTTANIPTGSKIKSLRATARCGTITGSATQPRCLLWFVQTVIIALVTGNISKLLSAIFNWRCPRPPPSAPGTTWVLQELEYKTRDANNEEWTLSSINSFTVELGRDDAGTNLKIAEVYVDAAFNERPVGTAVGPVGPITDTTRPLVSWSYSDAESDPQAASRVLIFNDEQYLAPGFDPLTSKPYTESGWVLGDDLSWTVNADLVNDTYRAYVVVRQVWDGIGNHESVPTFIGWTQNVPGPPVPVITATADNDLNRVLLQITKGGSSPATELYTIFASDNAGVDYEEVRNGVQITVDGAGNASLYDYEAPLNRARWYKVLAYRTLGTIKVASGFSAVATATPRSKSFWLKDPLAPALNMQLPVSPKGDMPSQVLTGAFFKPLTKTDGRAARAIRVNGSRYGREGVMGLTFAENDQTNWQAFNSLYEGARTLLYQLPTGENYYIAFDGTVSVPDWDIDFGATEGEDPQVLYRTATVNYQEVDKPT